MIPIMLGIVILLLALLGSMVFYIFRQSEEKAENQPETAATTWETEAPTTLPTTEATTEATTEPTEETATEAETTAETTEVTTEATEEEKKSTSSGGGGGSSSGTTPPGGIHSVPCKDGKHMWVDLPQGLYNQKADCTQEGRATQVCGNCLELRWVVTAPPLGHDWVLIEDCPPSEGHYGYKRWECTRCNLVDTTDVVYIPPTEAPPEPAETEPPQPVETEPVPAPTDPAE